MLFLVCGVWMRFDLEGFVSVGVTVFRSIHLNQTVVLKVALAVIPR
jgi:hypothetical protein